MSNITLEKPTLTLSSLGNSQGKGSKKMKRSVGRSSGSIQAIQTGNQIFVDKNETICLNALKLIDCMVPCLSVGAFRVYFEILIRFYNKFTGRLLTFHFDQF